MNRSLARLLKIVLLIAALGLVLPASGALGAKPAQTSKQPTATGTGGAVAAVDHDASRVGMQVLREGGNAVDATVAAAAALGVTTARVGTPCEVLTALAEKRIGETDILAGGVAGKRKYA